MSFIIGVDVGGTNTDVAIVQGSNVIGWSKSLTTVNIIHGVTSSIELAIKNAEENGFSNVIGNIQRVNIGTTQFINAVIKHRGLKKVACIRLCGVTSQSLPPFSDFPDDLREQVDGGGYLLNGGFEFDSKVITELDENEIRETLQEILDHGVHHVSVAGIFSPTNPSHEEFVEKIISLHFPSLTCTLSCRLGCLGLLERENAAILNECLKLLCKNTVEGFKDALGGIGLRCPVYFTQNDGTLLSERETLAYPVLTFSSGATNSMRGAAYLSSVKDAIIVDIGGTSTDVGVLMNGFPRESSTRVKIGGVNINFRMPDTTSIGLGGGSIVKVHQDGNVSVGPSSVEYRIHEEALIFGGQTMVASDIAVACGLAEFGDPKNVAHLSPQLIEDGMKNMKLQVENAIDVVKLSGDTCSIILVGGGSILIDPKEHFAGASVVKRPSFYQVANAVGAAISQVSGTFDQLCAISESTRTATLERAKSVAIDKAIQNGAVRDSCRIVEISELKMEYMAVPYTRLCVKAIGDLQSFAGSTGKANLPAKKPLHISVDENSKKTDVETKNGVEDIASPHTIINDVNVSHTPQINENGEWVLNEWDVDCLAIGAGILGCGGGGSPYLGRLKLMRCLKQNKRPKIIHPASMMVDSVAFTVGYIGAPEVGCERINNEAVLKHSLQLSNELFRLGFKGGMTSNDVIFLAESCGLAFEKVDEETIIAHLSEVNHPMSSAVLMSCEIGGSNALVPLIVAAELDIPVIDCDGMGRAFPQLQHYTPFIYDSSPYPAVLSDHHGKGVSCLKCQSAPALEAFFRAECVKAGCSAGISFQPLTRDEVLTKTCQFTLSQAWYLGNAVKYAREEHKCPVDSIIQNRNGLLLSTGKISDVKRETKDGFTYGKIMVEGYTPHKNINIAFQNEFIIARCSTSNDVLATVPDLITVVDSDTGEPIMTSELRYGLRISVLVLPAMPALTTDKALEFVGPSAFGEENVQYRRCFEFTEITPIPQLIKE